MPNLNTIKFQRIINKIVPFIFVFLLFVFNSFSQDETANSLRGRFDNYHSNALQEKLFLHVDKTFYLAGEIIWFKIYAVDGLLNKPLDLSKVVYVELLNKDQKPVLQAKILMDSSMGNGSFIVPTSMLTGNYTLRAYTKWMTNFSADYFYEQPISIINTLKENTSDVIKKAASYDIQFFPEGGNLVDGLSSKIAFKITDENGTGIDGSGILLNQKNDTLLRFNSLHVGLGNFVFTPKQTEKYKAVITINNKTIVKNLPDIYEKGFVMTLTNNNDKLKVTVQSNKGMSNASLYLFVQTRHLVKVVQQNAIVNGEAVFVVDKSLLGDGISQFTVFNSDKQPLCERLYFKQPLNKLNIKVKTDKIEYSIRNKINLQLLANDQLGKSQQANMSMSVFLVDSFQQAQHKDIFSYLWLNSDLKGNIESPEYYFENKGTEVDAAMDNLMLTQGWRRFKWEEVVQNKKPMFEFVPELEGPIINAKILNAKSGSPVAGITTYLSVPDYNAVFATAVSKQNGTVGFNLKNIYGSNDIILQTNNKVDSGYKINISSPFADKFSAGYLPDYFISSKSTTQLADRSINVQAENAFLIDQKLHRFSSKTIDTTAFYGVADKQYYLDDFTRFLTMEEVIREYVLDVRLHKQADHFYFRVTNKPLKVFFEQDPLVLLDGVPVFDTDKMIDFDPLKIKKIEVVEHKYFLGASVNDGIINYKTYQGDLAGFTLDPNAVVLEYDGLQRQREFYSPLYQTNEQLQSRLPDLRNQLLWNPNIKTDAVGKADLSFYTSDVAGNYIIVVHGINADGLAGSIVVPIKINNKTGN